MLIDTILQEDIETVVKSGYCIDKLKESTVLVTGATGLIGSQLVKLLMCFNSIKNLKIRIIAFARDEKKVQKVYGELVNREDLVIQVGDINAPIYVAENVDYIIHAASATSSKYFVNYPVETITTAINGTLNVLNLAHDKAVKAMVYLSSLEVYGTPTKEELISEKDYGYIEPLSTRSSYSEGKRMAECLCHSYAEEFGVNIKIARLSQTFGAGVSYDDERVFAQFARCVIEKKNIILHTQGKTVRSYCYISDALVGILDILQFGKKGEAYNITNMNTKISIRGMAELVCKAFPEANICVEIDIPDNVAKFGYNPEMIICIDSTKLQELTGWKPKVPLEEMYKRMIASMIITKNKGDKQA